MGDRISVLPLTRSHMTRMRCTTCFLAPQKLAERDPSVMPGWEVGQQTRNTIGAEGGSPSHENARQG